MITEAQVKALLTICEYSARQIVEIRKDLSKLRAIESQRVRRLRESNAKHLAEKITLKQQLEEALQFK